jgi:hypothetical protein
LADHVAALGLDYSGHRRHALMPLVLLWAYFEVFNFAGPILNPSLWLLLGLNVVCGVCAIGIGIAPDSALRRALLSGG